MALLDALLLDPCRMNVWIAFRTDGVAGTGTHSDPYDGSTVTKFDGVMNSLGAYTRVHLGPGTFQTNGYADETGGGWQAKAGMKIVGSGVDVTTRYAVCCAQLGRHEEAARVRTANAAGGRFPSTAKPSQTCDGN